MDSLLKMSLCLFVTNVTIKQCQMTLLFVNVTSYYVNIITNKDNGDKHDQENPFDLPGIDYFDH